MEMRRRGMFFTFDAFFAAFLILFSIILYTSFFIEEESMPQMDYMSKDIVNCLASIKVSEVNDTWIRSLISSGEITHPNNSVIEQVGEFFVLNNTEYAYRLSEIVVRDLVPDKFGFEMVVNNEVVLRNSSGSVRSNDLLSSRRMISGIERFKTIRGATSKVYLEGFAEKTESTYIYFGGFIGQGNISVFTRDIPSDAILKDMYLELDAGSPFRMRINSNPCGGLYVPDSLNMTADKWNITSCNSLLHAGARNDFDIVFPSSELNNSYVSGGFVKVVYKTSRFTPYVENKTITYHFPQINGITNIFDAFYVPGTIDSMDIYLHFSANDTSYLTIGGREVHQWPGVNDSEQRYNITNADLSTSSYAFLDDDYLLFSNNTVPIRFASYQEMEIILTGGDADIVLITDLSGSMKKAVLDWSQGHDAGSINSLQECFSNVYNDPLVRRTEGSICTDLELTNITMSFYGNRVWPVSIDAPIIDWYNNPLDRAAVENEIMSYGQGNGKTCIACAINTAYSILANYSDDSREKFVVLMTDGVPTHCPLDGCYGNSSKFGTQQCAGLCDVPGNNCGDLVASCNQCKANPSAALSAIHAANRTYKDLNATFFTVGFGPVDSCSQAPYVLSAIANLSNGSMQMSTSITELRDIYQNISYEILNRIEQYEQTINFKGNLSQNRSIMFGDSYIKIHYTPIAEGPRFDEISIDIETDKFPSCTPTVNIPDSVRVIDAKVTSYSGPHWTDSLIINGDQVFNLSRFFLNYVRVGDPFFIYIPVNKLAMGDNNMIMRTGDSQDNYTGCSMNNTMIYRGLIKSSISYSDVLPKAEGCQWVIEFEDNKNSTIQIPQGYSGGKSCLYTNASIYYDVNDTYDSAAYELFYNLDFDGDGRVFPNFDETNLVVDALSVGKVPYPWGPAVAEVRVWK